MESPVNAYLTIQMEYKIPKTDSTVCRGTERNFILVTSVIGYILHQIVERAENDTSHFDQNTKFHGIRFQPILDKNTKDGKTSCSRFLLTTKKLLFLFLFICAMKDYSQKLNLSALQFCLSNANSKYRFF